MMKTNREGLTWVEWYNAATCFNKIDERYDGTAEGMEHNFVLYKAWLNGEDPTEYANITGKPLRVDDNA
jgi:hypothetical protein